MALGCRPTVRISTRAVSPTRAPAARASRYHPAGRMAKMDRAEFAVVLRTARSRVSPADVGLPVTATRRQVPGLRREELAELAGLGVDYVTRLEQGRGPRPSPQVLGALARTLRMNDDDRDTLFRLGGSPPPAPARVPMVVPPGTRRLLERMTDLPAVVLSATSDVLAWNRPAAALFGDFGAMPPDQRNLIRRRFLAGTDDDSTTDQNSTAAKNGTPDQNGAGEDSADDQKGAIGQTSTADQSGTAHQGRVADKDEVADEDGAADCVGCLRTAHSRYPDDPDLARLIADLRAGSRRFERLWQAARSGRRRGRSTVVRGLSVDCDVLQVPEADQTLLIFTSAGAQAAGGTKAPAP